MPITSSSSPLGREQVLCLQQPQPIEGEPKPCPKCGNERPVIIPSLLGGEYYVNCRKCHAETPLAKSKAAAIELWNNDVYDV
jgi:Lar family restriction alleviation protein